MPPDMQNLERLLRHVLDARRETDPRVHAVFVDGELRGREAWVCEGAHWYSNALYVIAFHCVVDSCAAHRAKVEGNLVSIVTDSDVLT